MVRGDNMKKIKDYKIVILLVLFQIVLAGFIANYVGKFTREQMLMAICILAVGFGIDIWICVSLRKVREKEEMERQVRTMRAEQRYEQENIKNAYDYVAGMEKKREEFYLMLDELYKKCDEGRDVDEVHEVYNDTSMCLANMRINKYCESPIVNAVITSKTEEMKANGIKVKVSIDEFDDDMGIERIDACSVFCNLLDNAIDACKKLDSGRFINIRAKKQGGYLNVAVENAYDGKLIKEGKRYKTSKIQQHEHGYGTKILTMIAERYDGRFYLDELDGMVKAVVLMKVK